jgi:hypothetical protein
MRARGWNRVSAASKAKGTSELWTKTALAEVVVTVTARSGMGKLTIGDTTIVSELRRVGVQTATAQIEVTDESWRGSPELVITLVNTTDSADPKGQRYRFEVELAVIGLEPVPFALETLPDSFRYNREIPALGINCGVEVIEGRIETRDTVVVDTPRPEFFFDHSAPERLDLSFTGLASDPLPRLEALSGMAQAVGYSMAAVAPILIGLVHDLTGRWTVPLLLMIAVAMLQLAMGVLAGRSLTIRRQPAG